MGEALDKVRKNLNLNNNPGAAAEEGKPDPLSELDAAIEKVTNIEARELLQTKARELKANMELRATQAEQRVKELTGHGAAAEDKVSEKEKVKQEIVANALLLLQQKVDPSVVAQYILGTSSPQVPISLGGGGQQGITITDVMTIMDRVDKNRSSSGELKDILSRLTDRVEAVERGDNNRQAAPPVTYVYNKGKLEKIEGNAPVIIEEAAPPPTVAGESLEVVKEKNRHEEKLEELKGTREYHDKITDIAGDAFENIGKGLASQVMESAEAGGGNNSAKLEYFICPEKDCGTKIPITPETQTVTCPKCHGIYTRKQKEETEE